MANEAPSKWRLVKCPRCLCLLPERADFALYKCGGCGTFLKAKNRAPAHGEEIVQGGSADAAANESIPVVSDSETKVDEERPVAGEIAGAGEQTPPPPPENNPGKESFAGDGDANDEAKEEKIDQARISPEGSSSEVIFARAQSSTSEVDFFSARISLENLSISRSTSKNSAFLGDPPKKTWNGSQLRPSNFQEPDRRAELLKGLEILKNRLADPYSQQAIGSRQSSVSSFGSANPSSEQRSMAERYHHHHSPGSTSSGFSGGSFGGSRHPEKQRQQQKLHCRPILGGAPFVLCNSCLQLLQLPVDFLIARGGSHKLRCGSCSHVLIFFFRGSGHVHEEPFSYSDEYGEPAPEKKAGKHPHLGFPLHRLMGYPSARDMIYPPWEDDAGVDFSNASSQSTNFFPGTPPTPSSSRRAHSSPEDDEERTFKII